MRRRDFLVGLGGAVLMQKVASEVIPLVTPQQFAQELRYRAEKYIPLDDMSPGPAYRGVVPTIAVLAPRDAQEGVRSPVHIELSFTTTPGARILPATFRVYYGFLRLDITDQVRQNATLTENGLVVENASVPSGTHRLYIQISDDQGRMNECELRFRVA